MLVNDFVEVTLFGKSQDNTYKLSPNWIYNNDQIWVVNDQDQLEQHTLNITFSGREQILVTGLPGSNPRIVTNRMDFAAPGMAVNPRDKNHGDSPAERVAKELTP